ncbi:MAG: DUF362 domain-containing protein [candidate division WOR-3 bacterium]|nr:MAG: DUF362 domain-containing protein [candidate division WOR-3 bacterium]
MKDITRRDFIKYCGVGALGLVLKPNLIYGKIPGGQRASDVIQCFDENATSGSSINEQVLQSMMDASIRQLTGITDVGEAWKSVFPGITENSVISIKVNVINEYLPTHPEFVNSIVNGLTKMQFGSGFFARNNVIVWDRTNWELTDGGFTIYDGTDPNTVRCFGTNHSGVGYDYTMPFDVDGITSYPSRILTEMTDYLINAAVLKDHSGAQITLTMKNHYGSVHNPGSLHSSGYTCNPDVPALNQQIRDVVVPNNIQKIFLVDGLYAKIYWGPSGPPNFAPNLMLMSFDPVACDWHGQALINDIRVSQQWPSVYASYIPTAASAPYSLGTTDVNLIEINNPSGIQELSTITPFNGRVKVTPNPFRGRTMIYFSSAVASPVHIDLIDPAGRVTDRIFNGTLPSGEHRIGYIIRKKIAGGNYFIRIHNNAGSSVKKVTIFN